MSELCAWLQLIRSPNVGPIRFWQLLKKHQTASNALCHVENIYSKSAAEDEIALHQKYGFGLECNLLELSHMRDAPPVISYAGNLELLKKPKVAIVGTRNPSLAGEKLAYSLAKTLSQNGVTVISGLARGIDLRAHQGSLDIATVGVAAGGLLKVYPQEHKNLYRNIAKQGLLLSEMPLHQIPNYSHFPRRNRIIAGLAQIAIVVEATIDSGSLITARMALEYNHDVGAVPGFPSEPRAKGCNLLLKQGAHLIEDANDILDLLELNKVHLPQDNVSSGFLSHFSNVPITLEEILTLNTEYEITEVSALLGKLEIQGLIVKVAGGFVAKG